MFTLFFSIGGTYFYVSKILRLVKNTAASFASLLVQLFQMVLLKLGYEYKGTFSVVFLGLQTECVYWAFFFFWTSSSALGCSSIVFWLAPVFLSFYYYLTCATLFIPFLSFESIKIALHEIHMLILLESCRVIFEWRNLIFKNCGDSVKF